MPARLPRSLQLGSLPALCHPASLASRRHASGASSHDVTPVELAYEAYSGPSGNETDGALVVLHGFLSKRNWYSLCKALAYDLARPVYALDLRNHGHSPLIGHSMGGKVAMAAVLPAPRAGEKLVVADIAPAPIMISPAYSVYVQAMNKMQDMGLRSRKDAHAVLRETESDPTVLAWLLANLESTANGSMRFRIPLGILGASIDDLGAFPFAPGERTWGGPTLFVKGEKSERINRKTLPIAEQLFPNMRLETLDAGHWVHAERPREFKELLLDFIGKRPA